MWKFMMEDFLTIKDLLDTLEGEEVRPKGIFDLENNKMDKKATTYIRQWIKTSSRHYVANETMPIISGKNWNQCLNKKLLGIKFSY